MAQRTHDDIPPHVVESTWRDYAAMGDRKGKRVAERFSQEQPALSAYLLACAEELSAEAGALLFYLGLVVYGMFERHAVPVPALTLEGLETAKLDVEQKFESLLGVDERILAARVRAGSDLPQPHVLGYLVEALMDPAEMDIPLSDDDKGYIFLSIAAVIVCFDHAACETGPGAEGGKP